MQLYECTDGLKLPVHFQKNLPQVHLRDVPILLCTWTLVLQEVQVLWDAETKPLLHFQ